MGCSGYAQMAYSAVRGLARPGNPRGEGLLSSPCRFLLRLRMQDVEIAAYPSIMPPHRTDAAIRVATKLVSIARRPNAASATCLGTKVLAAHSICPSKSSGDSTGKNTDGRIRRCRNRVFRDPCSLVATIALRHDSNRTEKACFTTNSARPLVGIF